jgi:hypothetical protein
MSVDKTSVGKKKPKGTKRPDGQNVSNKTSIKQIVHGDKTSSNITSGRQNVHGDKTSIDKMSVSVMFNRALLGNIFTEKSTEREGKIHQYTLSVGGGRGTCTVLNKENLYK